MRPTPPKQVKDWPVGGGYLEDKEFPLPHSRAKLKPVSLYHSLLRDHREQGSQQSPTVRRDLRTQAFYQDSQSLSSPKTIGRGDPGLPACWSSRERGLAFT